MVDRILKIINIMTRFEHLPKELINYILSFVENNDFYNCLLTAKCMHVHTDIIIKKRKYLKYSQIDNATLVRKSDLIGLVIKNVSINEIIQLLKQYNVKIMSNMFKFNDLMINQEAYEKLYTQFDNECIKLSYFITNPKSPKKISLYHLLIHKDKKTLQWLKSIGKINNITKNIIMHFIDIAKSSFYVDYNWIRFIQTLI